MAGRGKEASRPGARNAAGPLRFCGRLSVIDLGTVADLHEHRHRLDAYCPRCDRWAELPLAEMVAAGYGERRMPLRVRCRNCGEHGRLQVRPPVLMTCWEILGPFNSCEGGSLNRLGFQDQSDG